MPKQKGALRRIPPEVKLEIARYTRAHPEKTREALASELTDLLSERSKSNPAFTPPQDSTLIKRISEVRNVITNGLDQAWHSGSLEHYPLTPEAVKKIFELKAKGMRAEMITVRVTRWISRFVSLPLSVDMLFETSFSHAWQEELCEAAGVDVDMTEQDSDLLRTLQDPELAQKDLGRWDEDELMWEVFPETAQFYDLGRNVTIEQYVTLTHKQFGHTPFVTPKEQLRTVRNEQTQIRHGRNPPPRQEVSGPEVSQNRRQVGARHRGL